MHTEGTNRDIVPLKDTLQKFSNYKALFQNPMHCKYPNTIPIKSKIQIKTEWICTESFTTSLKILPNFKFHCDMSKNVGIRSSLPLCRIPFSFNNSLYSGNSDQLRNLLFKLRLCYISDFTTCQFFSIGEKSGLKQGSSALGLFCCAVEAD